MNNLSLYQINEELERLQNMIEYNPDLGDYVDLDTGEILTDVELQKMFDEMKMDKQEALKCLVGMILSDRQTGAAIREEEKRLANRRKAYERRADRYQAIVEAECPEKTDFGIATLKYTTSHPLECESEAEAIKWLEDNGHAECVKVTKELKKTETKGIIKEGAKVPGCKIVDKKSASLK